MSRRASAARRMPKAIQSELRERLAQESARLMIEHGIVDYGLAKRKAAERLSVTTLGALPSNAQIEACLAERQRIFEADGHADRLKEFRHLALRLMGELSEFEPRLAGPVLAGTATSASRIELHVFAAGAEAVGVTLERHGHRLSRCSQRYRFGGGRQMQIPGYRFQADGAAVLTPVFPENGIREAPLSAVDRRPMARASRPEIAALIAAGAETQLRSPVGT
jgi:hypothetical protein